MIVVEVGCYGAMVLCWYGDVVGVIVVVLERLSLRLVEWWFGSEAKRKKVEPFRSV